MAITIGNRYIIHLGRYRGTSGFRSDHSQSLGYLPPGMLQDGSIVTVLGITINGWYKVDRCGYVYPAEFLIPTNKRLRLLNSIVGGQHEY